VTITEVRLDLGWGPAKLSGTWTPDTSELDAAWELYVELVTRIAVIPLTPETGVIREALTSLYELFGATRAILRKYGPAVARPTHKKEGDYRFGHLAVWLLNANVRPFLSYWHPALQQWEASRPPERSIADHERAWPRAAECRAALEALRQVTIQYAEVLAVVCEAPALIDATHDLIAAAERPRASAS
jgi:hypothetical protein